MAFKFGHDASRSARPDQAQASQSGKEDFPNLQLFGQTLDWLKKQQTGLLKDYPIPPPSDPELQRLVSAGLRDFSLQ